MYVCSNPLQFEFKRGYSTTLCTGIVKNVVSQYIHNGSAVLGCILNASKAFDIVDMVFFFVHSVIEVYLYLFLGSCCLGMLHNKCRCIGELVFLICSMFVMVFGRVVFSHQFCLLCIWMVYWLN